MMDKEGFRKLFAKWAEEDIYISHLTWEEADALAERLASWFLEDKKDELIRYRQYVLELDRELQTGEKPERG